MPTLSDYLHSPAWWVTAVVVGLLLNIAGTLVMRAIDRWRGEVITRWSKRTAAKRRRRAQLIAGVRASADRLIWIGFEAQRLSTAMIVAIVAGFAMLILALVNIPPLDEVTRVFVGLLGGLAGTLGMLAGSQAADLHAVMRAVEPEWPELGTEIRTLRNDRRHRRPQAADEVLEVMLACSEPTREEVAQCSRSRPACSCN